MNSKAARVPANIDNLMLSLHVEQADFRKAVKIAEQPWIQILKVQSESVHAGVHLILVLNNRDKVSKN